MSILPLNFKLKGGLFMVILMKKQDLQERRKHPRTSCFKVVGYATHDYTDMEYIQDINAWGVFIRTNKTISIGENISVTIPITNEQKSIKIIGEVVRASSQGIGVKFKIGIDDAVINAIAYDK